LLASKRGEELLELDLIHRQLMLAIVAINGGHALSDYIADSGDYGRKFKIEDALKRAKGLDNHFDDDELEIVDELFAKLSIKRDEKREKDTIANQILVRLL
jgi:hypothetical protein